MTNYEFSADDEAWIRSNGVKSRYSAMAWFSMLKPGVNIFVWHDNPRRGQKTAERIREKPPEDWPSGRFLVVGRVSRGRGLFVVRYLGQSETNWIEFEWPDFGNGRPLHFENERPNKKIIHETPRGPLKIHTLILTGKKRGLTEGEGN